MNLARCSKLFLVLLLSGGLAVAACGEDTTENQDEEESQSQQNNGEQEDECTIATENTDCAEDEICDEDEDPNVCVEDPEYECGDDTECDGDLVCIDNKCEEPFVEAKPTPTCEDADPPARCDADPADFEDFGPGSYINMLAIAESDECCVDFTDTQEFSDDPDAIDNILPELLGLAADRDEVNDSIAEMLDDGEFSIVLEHDGFEELEAGQEFDINFLFGEDAPTDGEVVVDPISFESGTHPHALVPNAVVTDSGDGLHLEAGPGNVVLSLDLGNIVDDIDDLELDLTISNAMLRADITDDSSIEDGIGLENGELGGLIRFAAIADALNDFASDCDCLDNPDPILELDGNDAECTLDDDTQDNAEDLCADDEICGALGEYCSVLRIAPNFADVDTTNDGEDDAFSAGITFGAEAVTIIEVGDGAIGAE